MIGESPFGTERHEGGERRGKYECQRHY
jgi:hypothetical protein